MTGLADAVATAVAALGAAHLDALAAAYRASGSYNPAAASKARSAVPAPHHDEVERINHRWAVEPNLPGAAIALALDSIRASRRRTDLPRVEVVATGPNSPAAPVRLTSEVVRQLIDRAAKRVTMVSYAAYQLPTIVASLHAAVARGVQVSLILESPENLEGGGGAHAYAAFHVYHWPIDRREPPDAKLHAKAVIVDGRDVLLTSANMTTAAYDKNIELGVLCRGGGVADRVQHHFDGFVASGVLRLAPLAPPI